MKIIDTHSHIYLEEFDEDRSEVVARARERQVGKIILPAIDLTSLDRLLDMCREYSGYCYPLLGLHPEEVKGDYKEVLAAMKAKLAEPGAPYVGVGEVGLDFYWDETYRKEQMQAFDEQVQWAIEYNLPLVIHTRSAHKELVSTLYKYKGENLRGIFHCFGGTEEECRELLEFEGFCLGIGGVLTFKKSTLPQVLRNVPLTRLVVETDAPYLAPVPHRGKRNESAFVFDTLTRLAEIKEVSLEEAAKQTTENAERLFFG